MPYDFIDNLKKSKKQVQKDGRILEEAYAGKKPYDDGESKVRGSPNHIGKWTEAVRDAYIRDDSRSPSPEQKRRPKTAPANGRSRDGNANRKSSGKTKWKGRKTIPDLLLVLRQDTSAEVDITNRIRGGIKRERRRSWQN